MFTAALFTRKIKSGERLLPMKIPMRVRELGLALCLLFLGSAPAGAQAEAGRAASASSQLWLNAGTLSYHFDRDNNFREDNIGFGAEAWLARDHALLAGTFINSVRTRSHYGAYLWRPLHWRLAGVDTGVGIAAGLLDGYPRYRNGGWFPAILPVLSVEYGNIGLNLFIVPAIRDRVDGAVSLQIKLRVW